MRFSAGTTHSSRTTSPVGEPRTPILCSSFDTAMRVTTDCVQLLGGIGYTKDVPAERFMRDAKITQIYEGTNQIQRVVIARELLKAISG